jgi:hypothetical protein
MDSSAPQFLNVLRVCDVPHAMALVAPRPLTIAGISADHFSATSIGYEAAGAKDRLTIRE